MGRKAFLIDNAETNWYSLVCRVLLVFGVTAGASVQSVLVNDSWLLGLWLKVEVFLKSLRAVKKMSLVSIA